MDDNRFILTFRFEIDILWVLLLAELWHAEILLIDIDMVQHVGVLVTA